MWSLSGLAAWGGSMGVDPPAGRHCSVMSAAAAAAAAAPRATRWIDILHVSALLMDSVPEEFAKWILVQTLKPNGLSHAI